MFGIMTGTIVNAILVIIGGLLGAILKKNVPKRLGDAVMTGLALCVFGIGVDGALLGENALIAIISMAVGGFIGEAIDIDKRVKILGDKLEEKVTHGDVEKGSVSRGFVSATLLFCVGAMSIMGSLSSGLSNDHSTQIAKGLIDGIAGLILASTMGWGVCLAAISIIVYQGLITLFASYLAPILSASVVAEMTCVGSLLICGIAFNMLGLTKIKLINFTPAIFIPIILCMFM